jgi:ribosome-binding protein aMBF1 (putative translation factor)
MPRRTAFDRYFDAQMKHPGVRSEYERARREIDAVDSFIRALDAARIDAGLSKAELARRISAKPEMVRRLFTSTSANPTVATVAKLAEVLGLKLELVPADNAAPATRRRRRARPEMHP